MQLVQIESYTCTCVPCAMQFDICCLLFACLHYMTLPPSVSVVLCLAVIATHTFHFSVNAQNNGSAMYHVYYW
jgi:hypothetical protein